MNSEYDGEQRNSTLDRLKQRTPSMPSLTDQQPNILYTMPMQTLDRLEKILRGTLALQGKIESTMTALATKESLKPLATGADLKNWMEELEERNQETIQSAKQVLWQMEEQQKKAGKENDSFLWKLSDADEAYRYNGENMLKEFRGSIRWTILGSAGASMLVSILLWVLLK